MECAYSVPHMKSWTGRAVTGRGEARQHLLEGLDVFQKTLGGSIVPGTLNVELNRAFLAPPESVAIPMPRLP
jgi:CTP-dependent riboflavin kinase